MLVHHRAGSFGSRTTRSKMCTTWSERSTSVSRKWWILDTLHHRATCLFDTHNIYIYIRIYTYVHIYIYIYVYILCIEMILLQQNDSFIFRIRKTSTPTISSLLLCSLLIDFGCLCISPEPEAGALNLSKAMEEHGQLRPSTEIWQGIGGSARKGNGEIP